MDLPSGKTKREVIDQAVIRFAGDSGDGMQITGSQFTNTVALYGNDIATFPDYPAEIRAPAGTVPGVSGFQLPFGGSAESNCCSWKVSSSSYLPCLSDA